jgi:predicted transcriptional regulator
MTKAVSVKLEDDERVRLALLAEAKKRTPHYLMREAIREYLTREEQRVSFIKEAQDAWRDYERTGRHVTLEDMEAWAEKLAKNPSVPLPKWRG